MTLFTAFGSAIGRGAHFQVGPSQHFANLFTCLVGETASRKRMAWDVANYVMERADPAWAELCVSLGLSSGEGLIERVRDFGSDSSGQPGNDKRLLALEEEFSRLLQVKDREGNTLSAVLRASWDGRTLETNTRKSNRLRATGAHISVVAHITPDELHHCLSRRGSIDVANGFSNRFLFTLVRRSKSLPHGGDIGIVEPYLPRLTVALAGAKVIGTCRRSTEADRLWEAVYDELSEGKPGAFGCAVARAVPQVMRLALIYALADCSPVIEVTHLRAALGMWTYCEESARQIFGESDDSRPPINQPLAFKLLPVIQQKPGVNRKGLHDATGRHHKAKDIGRALTWLEHMGLVHSETITTGGRPAECWWPGPRHADQADVALAPEVGELCDQSEGSAAAVRNAADDNPAACGAVGVMDLSALISTVKANGWRFRRDAGKVVVDGPDPLPEDVALAVEALQKALVRLIPQADG